MTDQPISPDLALIDPGLARASRRSLPRPGLLPTGVRHPDDGNATRPCDRTPPDNARRPRRRKLAIAAATGAVAAATTAAAFLAIALTSRTDTAAVLATPTYTETHPAARPSPRHDSAGNTWPAVPGAHGYSVALARDGALVYQATTRDTTFMLRADLHLAPGRYTWAVIPQPDHPTSEQPHRPLVATTFTVPAG